LAETVRRERIAHTAVCVEFLEAVKASASEGLGYSSKRRVA
jgi:hypothetical protein